MMNLTWNHLIEAFVAEGWSVAADSVGITLETEVQGERTILSDFARTAEGLRQAQQCWEQYCSGLSELTQPSLDQMRASFQHAFREAWAIGPITSLEALHTSQRLREQMELELLHLQRSVQRLEAFQARLPQLPAQGEIAWAQAVSRMSNLAFLELDTTGLRETDEIVRLTLLDRQGQVLEDVLIQPQEQPLSASASAVNGIAPAQLDEAPPIFNLWDRLRQALAGRYVLSFNLSWDLQQLERAARRYHLEPVLVIGDCLQQHATRYYQGEYALKLEELCARVGSPLPARPQQTSIDRARGQRAALAAMTQAVTDVRPAISPLTGRQTRTWSETPSIAGDDFAPFLDADELP